MADVVAPPSCMAAPWPPLSASSATPVTSARIGSRVIGVVQLASLVEAGPGWPAWLPSAVVAAPVRTWVPEDLVVVKADCSKGLSVKCWR